MSEAAAPRRPDGQWLDAWPGDPGGAPAPLHPCGDRPAGDVVPLDDAALACVAMDVFPGVGARAPGWLLGPWADLLRSDEPRHRAAWLAAVGAAAFTRSDDLDRTPARSWQRDDPRPTVALRRRLVAVQRAPWMVWRLRAVDGAFALAPMLPVQAWWCPPGKVSLASVGSVDGGPVDGGALVCRGLPVPGGWHAALGVTIAESPPQAVIDGAWSRLVRSLQAENPSIRREDVLRMAGHLLMRVVHLHAWRARSAVTARAGRG